MPSVLKKPRGAPWLRCTLCDDFWCVIHGKHVSDCACPPLEDWKYDPYAPDSTWAWLGQRGGKNA